MFVKYGRTEMTIPIGEIKKKKLKKHNSFFSWQER